MQEVVEQHHQQLTTWDGYVDWRNRPSVRGRHGGMMAASFVLVVEILENLAYLANASNLVLYLTQYMHLSPSKSANSVTNFMGTAFLLALLGGFLSDAFFTSYQIFLSSALVQFLGLIVLTIQARSPSLKPPACNNKDDAAVDFPCEEVAGVKAAMLFVGLYIVALGVGGIKGSLPAHGAEQFDEETAIGRKQRSSFFNYYVFCLACGALVAVTLVVWIEDNKGWQWGFGVSTLAILLSIPVFLSGSSFYRNKIPTGSPLTTISKVCLAAVFNNCIGKNPRNAIANLESENPSGTLKFLNRASQNKPVHPRFECSIQEVEEVKVVLGILPIFACTIMLNCCLAQLSTFSVQQAATMDTKLGSLRVPPASLPVFPVVFIMTLAPAYDHFIIPFARRVTNSEMGVTHLQRIGVGLFLSVIAMAVAAVVEIKRRTVASDRNLMDSTKPLPITFLWVGFQYLFLGSADLFTLAGLLEFFFTEAPMKMRSLATSLSWASLAVGYYLSSVIVSIVNEVTGGSGHRRWLSGANINHFRLDRFYWLMCSLSGLNFLHYLFWASKYKYRSNGANK
ncbi:protein NRT1/ PTR FAMILY 4.6-like [Impatiens glandulifera]|uniref:protein NRT1/ PTR FAMILY 4.6-like n=1 Tax=Impatiens glandulifera TaxID=253017 RepID=UPI001FB0D4B1|nr:protein NRT1/ PTR FAMILY 4.6-like [Impatiens glandulifera]